MGLTRAEFYSRIGLFREIDPLTDAAYKFVALLAAEKPRHGHSHEAPWHVAFHGSEFPGDYESACGRRALYTMMDFPRQIPSRWLEQIADAGKGIEDQLVRRWYEAGYLVTAPAHLPWVKQTQFSDNEHWLTSTVDAIVCWPRSNDPIVTEVKSKDSDVILAMQRLTRGPDVKHVRQVKTQIGLAHEQGPITKQRCYNTGRFAIEVAEGVFVCPQHFHARCLRDVILDPPNRGRLYYVSRDNPIDTFEFMFEYDPDFMKKGRTKLKAWRESFKEDELPQTNFDDKKFSHPFGWQWTKDEYPCKYCDFGAICREDHREAVKHGDKIRISESVGVADAKELREDYDVDLVRMAVERYWDEDLPVAA